MMRTITEAPAGRTRLLSLDGGGIRGLFALQYAGRIEELLREKTGKQDLVLAHHFHFIGGTSTGAIIAAFLSWGLSVKEIERLYRENAMAMFRKAGWLNRFTSHKFVAEAAHRIPQEILHRGRWKRGYLRDEEAPHPSSGRHAQRLHRLALAAFEQPGREIQQPRFSWKQSPDPSLAARSREHGGADIFSSGNSDRERREG